jgi:peroxiredoxin
MPDDKKPFDTRSGLLSMTVAISSALVMLITMLPVSYALAVLQPGQKAPSFELKDRADNVYRLDKKTSEPVLLVFVKPGDRHSSAALQALDNMVENLPSLKEGLWRWIIVSRIDTLKQAESVASITGPSWPLLLDLNDKVYKDYKIIATPTVVIVGRDRRVEAINPGYDLGMEDNIRKALARVLSVTLPEVVSKQPTKPNMNLQMGRRMAARGLWEKSLDYYTKAMEEEPLSAEALVELSGIYLELGRAEDAIRTLNQISADSPLSTRVDHLLERARALKEKRHETAKPPKVTR